MKTVTKNILFSFCKTYVEDRIARLNAHILGLQESLGSETKSSAGDKHETGRAMVQLEREKLGKQLAEAEKMQQVLQKVVREQGSEKAGLGSWVKTSKDHYYLAISAGAYTNTGETTYCVSMATPIAQSLLGKSKGEALVFNGTTSIITEIL